MTELDPARELDPAALYDAGSGEPAMVELAPAGGADSADRQSSDSPAGGGDDTGLPAAGGPEQPAGAADPPPLQCGTYALYGDDRGGLVLVVQDGPTGDVRRFSAPALVVRTLLRRFAGWAG